ncbi:MAG: dipeptide ABC transporter ATP-binding protein, partial [Alphaproteobacteria bacterium]
MSEAAPVLELDRVRLSFVTRLGEINVTPGLSLRIARGEALGLVGESGSGKSTVAFAILRYLGPLGRIMGGRILFEGRDIAAMSEPELRAIRGRRIAIVYQDPMSSLNPVMTIGRQLMEVPMLHEGLSTEAARTRAVAMLAEVNFADPAAIMARYPHQLSGGQQQRIVIAMALIAKPALLIMDEPTTGLDVTVEAAVLELVAALRRRHDTALLFISHNLGTVAQLCDRIVVLYGGEAVEEGPIREVFRNPRHPYTRGLLDCLPRLGRSKAEMPLRPIPGQALSPAARPPGCGFAPRCSHADPQACKRGTIPRVVLAGEPAHQVLCVKAASLEPWRPVSGAAAAPGVESAAPVLLATERLAKEYRPSGGPFGGRGRPVQALNGVDLAMRRGETLAIVGESGCGKSTFARLLSGLEVASAGRIELDGEEIGALRVEARSAQLKRKLQMVFQNPDSTLNPSHRVGYSVARALKRLKGLGSAEAERETQRLFEVVKLSPELAQRMPHQLSGGQKQRVAIARALAGAPEVVIADEPVSSLDVSVQAAIVNLLVELQAERHDSLVFISHDLGVVRYLADHVAVMYLGKIVEFGPTDAVFVPPHHPYTEALLSAVPEPDPERRPRRIILEGTLPSAAELPK